MKLQLEELEEEVKVQEMFEEEEVEEVAEKKRTQRKPPKVPLKTKILQKTSPQPTALHKGTAHGFPKKNNRQGDITYIRT